MLKEKVNIAENKFKAKKGMTFYNLIAENDEKIVKDIAICKLNGRNYELNEIIEEEGDISLIGFDSELGMKIYTRTLQFIFIKATLDLFKDAKITLEHSISKAIYGEIYKENPLTENELKNIKSV